VAFWLYFFMEGEIAELLVEGAKMGKSEGESKHAVRPEMGCVKRSPQGECVHGVRESPWCDRRWIARKRSPKGDRAWGAIESSMRTLFLGQGSETTCGQFANLGE
jgi:hypothetical protein